MKDMSYELLDLMEEKGWDEKGLAQILEDGTEPWILEALSPIRENLVDWLDIAKDASVLEIGSGYGALTGILARKAGSVDVVDEREENLETVRKWYDGYRFGETEVYNPWSVINYVNSCYKNKKEFAKPYWSNTSSNSIVRNLVEHADLSVKQEIEQLIEGGTIEKPIHEDITYDDMDSTQDNLWNFLFFTGYLKKISERQEGETIYMEMAIPNSEVRYVYKNAVLRWFEEKTAKKELTPLYKSMLKGDTEKMAEILSENLMETISFYDYQESYYHGFLVGMLKNIGNYIVQSNRESGNGRPDILVRYPSVRGKAIIIEIKVSKTYQGLEEKCGEALEQIEKQDYAAALRQEGYRDILKYGVAFYRKECMVKAGR